VIGDSPDVATQLDGDVLGWLTTVSPAGQPQTSVALRVTVTRLRLGEPAAAQRPQN